MSSLSVHKEVADNIDCIVTVKEPVDDFNEEMQILHLLNRDHR